MSTPGLRTNPWLAFLRTKLAEQHVKGVSIFKTVQSISAQWKSIPEEDKPYWKEKSIEIQKMKLSEPVLRDTAPKQSKIPPFIAFAMSTRPKLLKSGLSVPQVAKELGERWMQMKEIEQKQWASKAKQMSKTRQESVDSGKISPKAQRIHKRAMISPYIAFFMQRRKALVNQLSAVEIFRNIASEWRTFSAKQRKPWVKAAEKLTAERNAAMTSRKQRPKQ